MAHTIFTLSTNNISRRSFLRLLGIGAASLLTSCSPISWTAGAGAKQDGYFPTGEWRTSTPEEQGIDSQGIINMLEQITTSSPYMHSFLLIRNGALVSEAYFAPVTKDLQHFLFSATKSVTSALVGIAIQDGFIKGANQKILDFFPEMKAKSTSKFLEVLTIENLLTMSSGNVDFMTPSPYEEAPVDWVEKFLANPTNTIIDKPGSTFLYTSGAAHTLSAVIQKATGKMTADYAAEKLFGPLGITDFIWLPDQNGISFGNSWLKMKPIDMAKLGYLYLNQGAWNGKQIIPKAWVAQSSRKHIETKQVMFNSAEQDGYGYLWWMNGFGGYSAHGYGGQFIFVIPELSLVAVFTGGFDDSMFNTSYQLMKKYILPAVKSSAPLAKNTPAQQQLSDTLNKIAHPQKKAMTPLPGTARIISGKMYQIKSGIKFIVTFNGSDEYNLKVLFPANGSAPETTMEYHGGLDAVYRLNNNMDMVTGTYIAGMKGNWIDDNTFVQQEFVTDNVSIRTLTCHYEANQMTITSKEEISGRMLYEFSEEAVLIK